MEGRLKSMVVWLIMAAICGLIGFVIVFYYATNERPVEQFAIVVDAGSTQTRSSLYQITVRLPELMDWTGRLLEDELAPDSKFPLSELITVRQVSNCVNGGPLASISSPWEARLLLKDCLTKFARHTKLLDFVDLSQQQLEQISSVAKLDEQPELLDADEVSQQLALANRRVNSITWLHLGATAGMRALEQLNRTRALEKMLWMKDAASASNELLPSGSPFINPGFVGIISGAHEASFGWLSVNFVCDTLDLRASPIRGSEAPDIDGDLGTFYRVAGGGLNEAPGSHNERLMEQKFTMPHSIGTLELGGASAQMALQVPETQLGDQLLRNISLNEHQLSLFNGHYRMATRSDLCLGMSQAVLRLNYVLLYKTYAAEMGNQSASIEVANPCLQRGARLKFSGGQLASIWRDTCLIAPEQVHRLPVQGGPHDGFRASMARKLFVEFTGTGHVEQCDLLLNELLEPSKCKLYFSLCPQTENRQAPPPHMPFVTISGYNHAINVLGLNANRGARIGSAQGGQFEQLLDAINNKLGGGPIDYHQLRRKTTHFCATDTNDLLVKFPKVNTKFKHIICLQLVYIRKLLVEFYRFEPETSWSQINFLVFTPKSLPSQFAPVQKVPVSAESVGKSGKLNIRRDIGWTLGLLLNTTSEQLVNHERNQIYFHHGASVMFIMRATIMLVLACCLIAIGMLVLGIVEVRQAQARADAHESPDSMSSSLSSYDVSHLAVNIRTLTGNNKSSQRYVLNASQ